MSEHVHVVGGGIAGSEAAWQIASRGVAVTLHEMRPGVVGPAHHTGLLAELVCSNSLKSDDPSTAAGCLKHELEAMDSLIMRAARANRVAAGGALAVEREPFSQFVTSALEEHPLVTIRRGEVASIPDGTVILATGPLTSDALQEQLSQVVGETRLSFYDAAAPVIEADSIDRSVVFAASRYDKGGTADYLNAPLDRAEYERFVDALLGASRVIEKPFERRELFAACQPIEEVARTGHDAIRFGALKPVGLVDPRTGQRPWAVVQLRAENAAATAYNLVGFQTNLTFPEQRRVFRMIPGLEGAEFSRYGVMHRNTFVDAPRLLDATLALREHPRITLAGQLTGTEGYLEAAASGLVAGLNVVCARSGLEPFVLPPTTVFGALLAYATDPLTQSYQPMHVNFGILPALEPPVKRKQERYAAYAERARGHCDAYVSSRVDLGFGPAHDRG